MKRNTHFILFFLLSVSAMAQQDALQPEASYVSEKKLNLPVRGEVKAVYENGKPHYNGHTKNKKLHGAWQSWYSNQQSCDSGTLVKGIPDGEWRVWYADGQVQFVRNYSADKWQRFQNEKDGANPKQIVYPLTTLYKENRSKARQYLSSGYSFCLDKDCGSDAEAGLPDHYHPVFETGLLHGEYINYFPNGTVKDSGYYENGLPHGPWAHRSADQQYWQGHYQHGLKDKEWKHYDATGRLLEIVDYKKGEEVWRKKY